MAQWQKALKKQVQSSEGKLPSCLHAEITATALLLGLPSDKAPGLPAEDSAFKKCPEQTLAPVTIA